MSSTLGLRRMVSQGCGVLGKPLRGTEHETGPISASLEINDAEYMRTQLSMNVPWILLPADHGERCGM